MKLTLPKKASEKEQLNVDIRESFALWDTLSYKYLALERLLLWQNFVHDPDLKAVLAVEIKHLQRSIDTIEKLMQQYSVPSPDKNRTAINAAMNPDEVTDKFIASDLLLYSQESIEGLLAAFHGSITSDNIRTTLRQILIERIDSSDVLIKYAALRGFIGVVPSYKHLPPDTDEKLSVAEAGNLWDHLTYRYANIHCSEVFKLLIHDKDFKVAIDMGLSLLVKQAKLLEKELKRFGIPFPQKPSNVTTAADIKTLQEDVHLFGILYMSIQGATTLHAKSYKQCMTNHRVRGIFKQLLLEEVEKLDDFTRFGKLKGWLSPVPSYGP